MEKGAEFLGAQEGEGVTSKDQHLGVYSLDDGTILYPDCGGAYTNLCMS